MNLGIATARLQLTPLGEEDVDLWLALRTDPDVMKYIAPPRDEDYLREVFPHRCLRAGGGAIGFWKIAERDTRQRIGTGLLLPLPVEKTDSNWDALGRDEYPEEEIEIGYNFLPAAWGKGYATEAARGLLRFAFTQSALEKVVAVTDPDNHASQNVLRKAGMADVGLKRAYGRDLPGFKITRSKWLVIQAA